MKIILADDHALFREGLRQLLLRLDDDVTVLEAECHNSALKLLAENPDADLALIDLHMPGRVGLSGLIEVLDHAQTVPVVVMSGSEDLQEIHRVIKSGAMGYIPKQEHADVMLCALHLVLSGGVYVPPVLMSRSPSEGQTRQSRLTPKQVEVLQQLSKGYSNKEIGRLMNLTEATVKCHTSAIFRELDAGSRTQAVSIAKQRGLIA